jgi:hypothetical protein
MVKIKTYFHILNISDRIRYLLGVDKNNVIRFLPSHGSPYIIVRYKQNHNHYNKVMNDNIVNNQWQSITVNMFFINGLFYLISLK